MDFKKWADMEYKAMLNGETSEEALFQHDNQSISTGVIFDKHYDEIDMETETPYLSAFPRFQVFDDLGFTLEENDMVTIRGKSWKVKTAITDGQGALFVTLKR